MLVALFAGGHILLEGPPGTAKTLLAHSFARAVGLDFGRIQFTPDLMPGDIIGANLFNFQTSTFTLTRGPIFTELLLADEINRTPPKTQAALLEAMQERTVTIDGESHAARPTASWWSRRRTRSSSRASIRCPRRSSTASCSSRCVDYPSAEEERRIIATHGARQTAMEPGGLGRRAQGRRRDDRRRDRRRRRASGWSTRSSTISPRWSAAPATSPTSRPAPARAPARCWPAPRARGPRSTAATSSSPTTSRRSPRRCCATA